MCNIIINYLLLLIILVITVTEWMSPLLGKNEFNKIIKSTARILSQSILQIANRHVISSVVSASLSSSPQLCSISSSASKKDCFCNYLNTIKIYIRYIRYIR